MLFWPLVPVAFGIVVAIRLRRSVLSVQTACRAAVAGLIVAWTFQAWATEALYRPIFGLIRQIN